MSIINITGYWNKEYHKKFSVPKGYIVFRIDDSKIDIAREEFKILDKVQKESGEEKKINIKCDIYYKKRTLSQNSLSWLLYGFKARILNGTMSGSKEQMITVDELYRDDVKTNAKTATLELTKDICFMIAKDYSIHEIKKVDEDKYILTIWKSTSHLDTKEMAFWLERQFTELAHMGVPADNQAEMIRYWQDWRTHLNNEKILLNDSVMTKEEYKSLNPICEATGKYLGDGSGQLAHIKAVGMGGDRTKEPKKNHASNWLHLCPEAHMELDNGKGLREFIKKYPWLTNKIESALRREYKEIKEEFEFETTVDGLDIF